MKLRLLATREAFLIGTGLAIFGTASFNFPAAASSNAPARPLASAGYSGSVSGSFVLGADNTDGSNPFNDYAVEGKVDHDVGGVGVLGYGQQAKSYGVYGVTFGQNGIGVYGAGDGPTPAPSTTANASNVTTGVVGDSHSGDGVFGTTEWSGSRGTSGNIIAGVVGVDSSGTVKTNAGVYGTTESGIAGVYGAANEGSFAGLVGVGTGSNGVFAFSDELAGVSADSITGYGVIGVSDGGPDNYPAAGGFFRGDFASLIGVANNTNSDPASSSYPIIAVDENTTTVFSVDNTGQTNVYGNLVLHDGQSTIARSRTAGVPMREYSDATSRPTAEDFGEAQITSGTAYVRLDPSFAQSIDDRTPYLVFITPNGETKGLYVENRTMTGFSVREIQGGRSNLSFSYRIVATRFGEAGKRMAAVRQSELTAMDPARFGVHAHQQFPKSRADLSKLGSGREGATSIYIPRPNLSVEHRSR